MNVKHNLQELTNIATRLRLHVVDMVAPSGQGYVQQGLGAADIFTTLYFAEATMDTANPSWPDRDRIFLTTAHNTAIFYATLAERGFFDVEDLATYVTDGSSLEINSSERMGSFVEATCGSLGQGLSVAVGCALAAKRQGRASRFYVILGDGEMQEGQVWEAAMYAGAQRLDNLCVIVDYNFVQSEGPMNLVMSLEPVMHKMESFGFACQEVDGNDIESLLSAYDLARETKGKPSFIKANTLMGKGVASLEGLMFHQLRFPPEVAASARAELEAQL
ncbi:MAG: transketolase [Paracoccaceae bacterium]|nr:transketolase [Paracoccaceae bacterium]MDE2673534.1 transketolase [Paracoccaceae bacterium]MYF46828.1 transketolase [Paracoccaceae bacterium]MYJ87750.1 transketolase [Paracoccaceae bacterium]